MTGLNPKNDYLNVFIHWHSAETCRIPGTAIEADLKRQTPATVQVTHYFDVERKCRECGRLFIFFAAEQKHWYEELGFGLDSDCLCCPPCRKKVQDIAQKRERYEELFHVANRSLEQNREIADKCLTLIEEGVFHARQSERVRMYLNRISIDWRSDQRFADFAAHLKEIEKRGEPDGPSDGSQRLRSE